MVYSIRNKAKSSRNPDGEEDVFDQVNWNDISRYKDEEQSLYTATFLQDEGNFTDNMVVGGTADEPFAYIVRYKPEEGEFDGSLSTFTSTIEMYALEGECFGHTKLRNGEDQSHLRGEAAGGIYCTLISYQIIESCSTGPNDYCTVITYKRILICGVKRTDLSYKIRNRNRPKNRCGYNRPPFTRTRRNLFFRSYRRHVLAPKRRRLKKPCPRDPIPNPEIAPQTYSKVKLMILAPMRSALNLTGCGSLWMRWSSHPLPRSDSYE